jgi:hypothetical protein
MLASLPFALRKQRAGVRIDPLHIQIGGRITPVKALVI